MLMFVLVLMCVFVSKAQKLNSPPFAKEKMGEQDGASLEVSASLVLLVMAREGG